MDLFTYLLKKKGHNSSVNNDLFSYLLASRKRGTYHTYTGTQINVSDSVNSRMKNWILGGNTNQNGTPTPDAPIDIHNVIGENNVIENSGKNLYEPIINTQYLNGIIPKIEVDGSISVSGTPTQAWSNICQQSFTYLEAGTYTFSISKTYTFTCGIRVFTSKEGDFVDITISPGNTKTTRTITNKIYGWRFFLTGMAVGTEINDNFKVQIETGSQATPFEKYKGKNYKVSLSSKNLFNTKDCLRGASYNYGTTGIIPTPTSSNARITLPPQYAIKVKPNTKYNFNMNTTDFDFALAELQNNKKTNQDSGWKNGNLTITTKNNTSYIAFNFRKHSGNWDEITDEVWNEFLNSEAQLEENEEATPYVPYLNIELCKIGDYQDKIYKQNDKWLLEKNVGKVVLNGSEAWSTQTSTTENHPRFKLYIINYNVLLPSSNNEVFKGICNYFIPLSTSETYNSNQGVSVDKTYNLAFYVNNITALEEFKTWLSSNNVILYYALATPNITEITDDNLINQLEELAKARSFENQTNISQLSEQLPFDLTVDIKTL